jgi:hypothetical protein
MGRAATRALLPASGNRRPSPPSACVLRQPGLAAGNPRRRSRAPPFRAFPPSEVGAGCPGPCPSWGSPRRVPDAASEPLQGVDPWTECVAVLEDRCMLSWGSSPLGRSPPSPWHPVWLRAPPPSCFTARCPSAACVGTLESCVAMEAASPSPAPALLGFATRRSREKPLSLNSETELSKRSPWPLQSFETS